MAAYEANTTPISIDLISLEEYKDLFSINSPDQDANISLVITQISEFVKNFCNRRLVDYYGSERIEYYKGNTSKIYLTEYPIVELTSVSYATLPTDDYVELTHLTDYMYNKDTGLLYTISGYNFLTSGTLNPVSLKVKYKAGYDTIPNDLKLCVGHIVHHYLQGDYNTKREVDNNILENPVTSVLPEHISRLLYLYRADLI